MAKKIGVLTGGGDCAGLNCAVQWVTKAAGNAASCGLWPQGQGAQILGIKEGWRGLVEVDPASSQSLERWTLPLDELVVRTWDRHGGTMLGTSRTNPFNPQNDRSALLLQNLKTLNLDALIAIGGEDTLSVAAKLHARGFPVVGIPKTIDRDLSATDYSLGYDSALNVIVQDIDRLRTTAGSHQRIFVVEVMGRHAGWLALEGGQAAGAQVILIPEYDFEVEKVCQILQARRDKGVRYDIVVVSEGAKLKGRGEFYQDDKVDAFGHKLLGGISQYLAREIQRCIGFETRHVVLSHLQRGGQPTATDRLMGRKFGIAAIDLLLKEQYGQMAALQQGQITSVPLAQAIARLSLVDVEKDYDPDTYHGKQAAMLVC